jgi:hypothetical protein
MGDKKKDMLSREYHTSSFVSVFMGVSMQNKLLDYRLQHYMSLLKYMEPYT